MIKKIKKKLKKTKIYFMRRQTFYNPRGNIKIRNIVDSVSKDDTFNVKDKVLLLIQNQKYSI